MRLIGQDVLDKFRRKHADTRGWIDKWVMTVRAAEWESIDNVRKAYPHADGVKLRSGNVVTVFNCRGNDYRLLTAISYVLQTVQVLEVMPHSEYSQQSWKRRH
jgi:mRNA interferase HigB